MKKKIRKKRISEEMIIKRRRMIFKKAFVKRSDMAEEYYFALIRDYLDGKLLDEKEYPAMVLATEYFQMKINSIISKIDEKSIYIQLASKEVKEIGFRTHNFKKELSEIVGKDIDSATIHFENKFKKNGIIDKNTIVFMLGSLSETLSGMSQRFYDLNAAILSGRDSFNKSIVDKVN